jgi:hypothetical protein
MVVSFIDSDEYQNTTGRTWDAMNQEEQIKELISRFGRSSADKELMEHLDGKEEQNATKHDANASSFEAGTHNPRAGLAADK